MTPLALTLTCLTAGLGLVACWCALIEIGNWRRHRWGKALDREYEQLVRARQITGGK